MQLNENPAITLPWLLRIQLWTAQTTRDEAINKAIACRAPAAAIRIMQSPTHILKAPVGAHTTHDPDYHSAVGAFVDSMRTQSFFYRALADRAFQIVPLRTRVGFSPTPSVATVVDEGSGKPVSAISFTTLMLEPGKVATAGVLTRELLDDLSAGGQQYFVNQLKAAVATAVDGAFLELAVDTGTTSTASSGTSAVNAKHDLRTAQLLVSTAGAGRFYIVCSSDVAVKAATLATADGADAFPAMSATGGEMSNLPAIVSAALPAGELLVVDASGFVAGGDTIETRASTQGDLLMNTVPNMSSAVPTPAQLVSMWQTNCTGYICEAWFGAQKMRDDCIAVVTGINWGGP
jgi:hypothetical protein